MSGIKLQDILYYLTSSADETGVLGKFSASIDDITKFGVAYKANKSHLKVYLKKDLLKKVKRDEKSASKSEELRLDGNKIYQRGQDWEALTFYNSSVLYAPSHSTELALALANRSAVLARLGFSKEAIQDIDLALKHGDSKIPRKKLLIRKAVQLYKLELYSDCLKLIQSLFPDSGGKDKEELKNSELEEAYLSCLKKVADASDPPGHLQNKVITLPLPKGGEHENFPSASACVTLKYSKEKGHHVVANQNLQLGDIIFVERPLAFTVSPDKYLKHCHHCCKEIVAFLPCEKCTKAVFCSNVCRTAAWSTYHQWECRALAFLYKQGDCEFTVVAHLALRVALLRDSSDKYKRLDTLSTHIQDMEPANVYKNAVTAALLTVYLEKHTSYFQDNLSLTVEEMGTRIMCCIYRLICNLQALTKIDKETMKDNISEGFTAPKIGQGVYLSGSMLNHSCDQNTMITFINDCMVVRAYKDIKKGEEIFNCYVPDCYKWD